MIPWTWELLQTGWDWLGLAGFVSSRSAWTTVLMRSLHPEKAWFWKPAQNLPHLSFKENSQPWGCTSVKGQALFSPSSQSCFQTCSDFLTCCKASDFWIWAVGLELCWHALGHLVHVDRLLGADISAIGWEIFVLHHILVIARSRQSTKFQCMLTLCFPHHMFHHLLG